VLKSFGGKNGVETAGEIEEMSGGNDVDVGARGEVDAGVPDGGSE